ncbi:MAG: hypothetical protein IJ512_04280 [Ruminococcus sp.]|nr:hypothetical protein [Ruminococcus sp.]
MKHTKFMKSVLSVCAAAAMGASCLGYSASAATDIPYLGPTDGALCANDDGSTVRMNIYNEWISSPVKDINNVVNVIDYIEVTFTISGLGDRTCNVNEDGSEADAYEMSLVGLIGSNGFWGDPETDTVTPGSVAVTGDGTYTVRTDLAESADTILCLILSSNINFYQLGEGVTGIADSGVSVTVDSISTGEESWAVNYGDVDGDGAVAIEDATAVLKHYAAAAAGLEAVLTDDQITAGDVDGDATVAIEDATAILKYYAAGAAGLSPVIGEYFPAAAQ